MIIPGSMIGGQKQVRQPCSLFGSSRMFATSRYIHVCILAAASVAMVMPGLTSASDDGDLSRLVSGI